MKFEQYQTQAPVKKKGSQQPKQSDFKSLEAWGKAADKAAAQKIINDDEYRTDMVTYRSNVAKANALFWQDQINSRNWNTIDESITSKLINIVTAETSDFDEMDCILDDYDDMMSAIASVVAGLNKTIDINLAMNINRNMNTK